jgi:hypothetical protein
MSVQLRRKENCFYRYRCAGLCRSRTLGKLTPPSATQTGQSLRPASSRLTARRAPACWTAPEPIMGYLCRLAHEGLRGGYELNFWAGSGCRTKVVAAATEQPTCTDVQARTESLQSSRLTAVETLAEADADDPAETLWFLPTGVNGGNGRSLDNLQSASRGRRGRSW